MKRIKALLSFVISIIFLFVLIVPCFAEQTDYDFLLSCGYSAEFLDTFPEENYSKMRATIGNYDVDVIEVSSNEKSNMVRGAIAEADLELQLEIAELCQKGTNIINGYLIGATWIWAEGKPINNLNQDAITINWNAELLNIAGDGAFWSQDWYKESASSEEIVFRECTTPAEAAQGGVGFYTELKWGKSFLGGCVLLLLETSIPMYTGTDYSSSINMEYAHDFSLFGIGGAGLGAGPVSVSIDCGPMCDTMAKVATFKYSV